jgi:hypothetical protein
MLADAGQIDSIDQNLAACRPFSPEYMPEECCLARPAGAGNKNKLALSYPQSDIM